MKPRSLANAALSAALVGGAGGVVYTATPDDAVERGEQRNERVEKEINAKRPAWVNRLMRKASDPAHGNPLNKDGVLLTHPSEVYRLFLPPHEMPKDGISPRELQALLGDDKELFHVEWRELEDESKARVIPGERRVGIKYRTKTLSFSEADYRLWQEKGVGAFEGDKKVVLEAVVENARTVTSVEGGVGTFAYAARFGRGIAEDDLVGAFPRRER